MIIVSSFSYESGNISFFVNLKHFSSYIIVAQTVSRQDEMCKAKAATLFLFTKVNS